MPVATIHTSIKNSQMIAYILDLMNTTKWLEEQEEEVKINLDILSII